jgi:FkbM family methyltransferase
MSIIKAAARRAYYALPPRLRDAALRLASVRHRGRVVTKQFDGYRATLHLDEVMEMASYRDAFEREVCDAIERHARPGYIALDIGANVGLHALRLAREVGPEGEVFAFEPMPYAFQKLAANAALNPHLNIKAHRLALSNSPAENVEADFRSSWRHDGSRADPGIAKVTFVRLDDWVRGNAIERIDIVKIDVDGYEGLVIEGGKETIARHRPTIIIEAFIDQYKEGRPDPFRLLAEMGYRFVEMVGGGRLTPDEIKRRLDALDGHHEVSFNLVAYGTHA